MPNQIISSLITKIHDTFNLDELQTLCLRLDVIYEDLPGDTRQAKARELVLLMEREYRIQDLVRQCQEFRPRASWYPGEPGGIGSEVYELYQVAEQIKARATAIQVKNSEILLPIYQSEPNLDQIANEMVRLFNVQESRGDFDEWITFLSSFAKKVTHPELVNACTKSLQAAAIFHTACYKLNEDALTFRRASEVAKQNDDSIYYLKHGLTVRLAFAAKSQDGTLAEIIQEEVTAYLEQLRKAVSLAGQSVGHLRTYLSEV